MSAPGFGGRLAGFVLSWLCAVGAAMAGVPQALYVASQDRVSAYRVDATGLLALTMTTAGAQALAVSPNGQFVFAARPGSVAGYRVDFGAAQLAPVGAAVPGSYDPRSVAVHPGGGALYVIDNDGFCGSNGTLYAYRIDGAGGLVPTGHWALTGHPMAVAIEAAGRYAYVANAGNLCTGLRTQVTNESPSFSVFALDAAGQPTGAVTRVESPGLDIAYEGSPLALDASTATIYVTGFAGTAGYHVGASGLPQPIAGFPVPGQGDTLALDRHGDLLVANAHDLPGQLMIYHVNLDGTLTRRSGAAPVAGRVTAMAPDADGQHFYVAQGASLQAYVEGGSGGLAPVGAPVSTGNATSSIAAGPVPGSAPPAAATPDLLVFGHGPSIEPGFERRPLRYDGRAGAFVGYFAGACYGFDMAYGPDGRLYVLDGISRQFSVCTPGNLVRRFDGRSGEFQEVDDPHANFVPMSSFTGLDPGGFAFGPDGSLFVSSLGPNTVLKYQGPAAANPGQLVGVFVSAGAGGLADPGKLRFGADGHLYVASRRSNQVLKFNGATGAFIGVFAGPDGGLLAPADFVFGPDGDLYVASSGNNRVLRYAGPASSTPGRAIGVFATLPGPPQGLAFGPAGDLFVAVDPGVFRYDGKNGAAKGQFALVKQKVGPLIFSAVPAPHPGLGDFDGNHCVDGADMASMGERVRSNDQSDLRYDLNGDGVVNVLDARKLALLFTQPGGAACPAAH